MASSRSRGKRKKGFGAAGFLLVLLLIAAVAAGVAGWAIFTPFGPSAETFVDIASGSSPTHIARQLQASGIIRNQLAFDLWRWVRRGTLKAGEYRFDHPLPLTDVYERIARGEVYTVAVTVPEGATVFE